MPANVLGKIGAQYYRYIEPIGSTWDISATPIKNHFFDKDELDYLLDLEFINYNNVIVFFVFQWSINFMRIRLTPFPGGSQNCETELLAKAQKETYTYLKKSCV